jgi:hypothetical protein
MLIGSSTTQRCFSIENNGWGSYLAHWYSRFADVLNRGSGGYNSRWCKQYLPKLIGNYRPDMAVIFIGNNDAIHHSFPQHVPIDEYRENVVSMLEYLYGLKSTMAIILITPIRVHPSRIKHSDIERSKYANQIREIVKNHNMIPSLRNKRLALVDLWLNDKEKGISAVTAEDLYDGLHLGVSGNKKLFDGLKLCINIHFPYFSPEFVKGKNNNNFNNSSNIKILEATFNSSLMKIKNLTSVSQLKNKNLQIAKQNKIYKQNNNSNDENNNCYNNKEINNNNNDNNNNNNNSNNNNDNNNNNNNNNNKDNKENNSNYNSNDYNNNNQDNSNNNMNNYTNTEDEIVPLQYTVPLWKELIKE